MRLIYGIWLFLLPLSALPLPALHGDVSSPECIDAHNFAKFVFNSKSSRLYAPLIIPNELESAFVLGVLDLDISGGAVIKYSPEVFAKLPKGRRGLYWELGSQKNHRLVVDEIRFSWQGDRYEVFSIDSSLSKDSLLKPGQDTYSMLGLQPFLKESWRPPIVFKHRESQRLWLINVGEPYQVLKSWDVYLDSGDSFSKRCEIRFLDHISDPMAYLPEKVRQLVNTLDETLGAERGVGESQSTRVLRLGVRHLWGNALLRPWAVSGDDRYNTKQEVDSNLEDWSKINEVNLRIYNRILETYPIAERELANYYSANFGLESHHARVLAEWILEVAFVANFVFHKEQVNYKTSEGRLNPWYN